MCIDAVQIYRQASMNLVCCWIDVKRSMPKRGLWNIQSANRVRSLTTAQEVLSLPRQGAAACH